jgi:hypothetical protein
MKIAVFSIFFFSVISCGPGWRITRISSSLGALMPKSKDNVDLVGTRCKYLEKITVFHDVFKNANL